MLGSSDAWIEQDRPRRGAPVFASRSVDATTAPAPDARPAAARRSDAELLRLSALASRLNRRRQTRFAALRAAPHTVSPSGAAYTLHTYEPAGTEAPEPDESDRVGSHADPTIRAG
jgi:hypothetical protein